MRIIKGTADARRAAKGQVQGHGQQTLRCSNCGRSATPSTNQSGKVTYHCVCGSSFALQRM